MTPFDYARSYVQRGWSPIPIPTRKKRPVIEEWEKLRLTEADIPTYFNGQAMNVGVLLGEPSNGLIDGDLDCVEAVRMADCFLPKTGAVFGRKSKQRSHRLFRCIPAARTEQFLDVDGTMILELRGSGVQTVFPGSVHESGESIEWSANGEPSRIEYKHLHTAVGKLAAMAIIARHWPKKGSRHNATNALAGALCNCPLFDRRRIPELVNIVSECAGDDEDRTATAALTVEKADKGEHITGWPTLAEIVGEKAVNRAMEWLGVSRSSAPTTTPVSAKPKSTPRRIAPHISFPVDVLPQPIRRFIGESAAAMGCEPSYLALPMLSAAASAIGTTRAIRLKRGWIEFPIVWTGVVGDSGTLKTPALKKALRPLRDLQSRALQQYDDAMEDYERQSLEYDRDLVQWKKRKDRGAPPEKPRPPARLRYVVNDITVEALAPLLQENARGVLLARDELGGWIGSFDRYVGRGGADAAHWCSMFNAEPLTVDRKSGPTRTIHVPRAAVSVCGGIQPGILDHVLSPQHRESGLLARLLLAMPLRRIKRWTDAEIDEAVEAEVRKVFERLYELNHNLDGDRQTVPVEVELTPEAKATWIEFYNAHAAEHAELTGDLSSAWSKLEGYAARLALVVHFIRWAASDPTLRTDGVDVTSIKAGIALSDWFGHEARRVYAILGESDEDRDRRRLVELIQRKGGSVTLRDVTRSCRMCPKAEDAEAALNGLEETGVGRWEHPSPGPDGGRPSRRFVLTDAVDNTPHLDPVDTVDVDNTPGHGPASGGIVNVNAVNAPEIQGSVGASHDACPDDEGPPPEVYDRLADDSDEAEREAIMAVEAETEAGK